MRIDRRRKLPVTTLLYALGLDDEEILSTFYDRIASRRPSTAGRCRSRPSGCAASSPSTDLIDAKTGKVVIEAGARSPRGAPRARR